MNRGGNSAQEEGSGRQSKKTAETATQKTGISSVPAPSGPDIIDEIAQPTEKEIRAKEFERNSKTIMRNSSSPSLTDRMFRRPSSPSTLSRTVAKINGLYNEFKDAERGVQGPTTLPDELPEKEVSLRKIAKDLMRRAKNGITKNHGRAKNDERK